MAGPYQTEAQARADAEPMMQEIAKGRPTTWAGREVLWRYLTAACEAAGVELGEFDRGILSWLCGYEPETVQVLIGIISRANRRD